MVAQRAAAGLCLDPALRARRSGRAGHLYNGYRITTVCTIDTRRGQERFSLLAAGWKANHLPIHALGRRTDLDHAGRWNAPAATHPRRPQHASKLEFHIAFSWCHMQATTLSVPMAL